MEYRLRINERGLDFQLASADEEKLLISADGASHEVRFSVISENRLRLQIDGRALSASLLEDNGRTLVMIEGQLYTVCEKDDAAAVPDEGGGRHGPREVTPPMPSVVVRLLVATGAVVEKDQPLLVVSAMKMETTLTAPFCGRVIRVNAAVGDQVMPGQILVELQADTGE